MHRADQVRGNNSVRLHQRTETGHCGQGGTLRPHAKASNSTVAVSSPQALRLRKDRHAETTLGRTRTDAVATWAIKPSVAQEDTVAAHPCDTVDVAPAPWAG